MVTRLVLTSLDLIAEATGNIREHLVADVAGKRQTLCGVRIGMTQSPAQNGQCLNCKSRLRSLLRTKHVDFPESWMETFNVVLPKGPIKVRRATEGTDKGTSCYRRDR